jgi:hypothetical protein
MLNGFPTGVASWLSTGSGRYLALAVALIVVSVSLVTDNKIVQPRLNEQENYHKPLGSRRNATAALIRTGESDTTYGGFISRTQVSILE